MCEGQPVIGFSIKKFLCAVAAFGFVSFAVAQSANNGELPSPDQPKSGGRVSLAVAAKADHFGSDEARVSALPAIEYQWANGWFAGSTRGVGYNFSKDPNLQYGVGLGLDLGRRESATGTLVGMGSIEAKVEYGAFVNYTLDRHWRLTSLLRYGSGDTGQGATANLGVNYTLSIAPQWRLEGGASTSWANAQSLQSYFGVTASQSQQSGNAVYSPGAGLRDLSASLKLGHQVTPQINVSAGVTATSLLGDSRNSALVTRPDTVSANLSVGYAF